MAPPQAGGWGPAGSAPWQAGLTAGSQGMAAQAPSPTGPARPTKMDLKTPSKRVSLPGWNLLASPPGTPAPQGAVNFTPQSGEFHPPGQVAPVGMMNYSLMPEQMVTSQMAASASPSAPMYEGMGLDEIANELIKRLGISEASQAPVLGGGVSGQQLGSTQVGMGQDEGEYTGRWDSATGGWVDAQGRPTVSPTEWRDRQRGTALAPVGEALTPPPPNPGPGGLSQATVPQFPAGGQRTPAPSPITVGGPQVTPGQAAGIFTPNAGVAESDTPGYIAGGFKPPPPEEPETKPDVPTPAPTAPAAKPPLNSVIKFKPGDPNDPEDVGTVVVMGPNGEEEHPAWQWPVYGEPGSNREGQVAGYGTRNMATGQITRQMQTGYTVKEAPEKAPAKNWVPTKDGTGNTWLVDQTGQDEPRKIGDAAAGDIEVAVGSDRVVKVLKKPDGTTETSVMELPHYFNSQDGSVHKYDPENGTVTTLYGNPKAKFDVLSNGSIVEYGTDESGQTQIRLAYQPPKEEVSVLGNDLILTARKEDGSYSAEVLYKGKKDEKYAQAPDGTWVKHDPNSGQTTELWRPEEKFRIEDGNIIVPGGQSADVWYGQPGAQQGVRYTGGGTPQNLGRSEVPLYSDVLGENARPAPTVGGGQSGPLDWMQEVLGAAGLPGGRPRPQQPMNMTDIRPPDQQSQPVTAQSFEDRGIPEAPPPPPEETQYIRFGQPPTASPGAFGAGTTQMPGDQSGRLGMIGNLAKEAGLDEEAARAAMAIAKTEGGLFGAVGDNGNSFGPFQNHRGGQLANLAHDLNMDVNQAGDWVQKNPMQAASWALRGYLGQKIREGQKQGLSGPELATYAQRYGQISQSPERAGANYQSLFAGGQGPQAQGGGQTLSGTQDASKAIVFAQQEIGKPYVGFGKNPGASRFGDPGYDCSSFVSSAFKQLGVNLTPYTDTAAKETRQVAESDARPGDIVFYKYNDPSQPTTVFPHMGLYVGNGQMIDASFSGGVGIRPLLNEPMEFHRVPGVPPTDILPAAMGSAEQAARSSTSRIHAPKGWTTVGGGQAANPGGGGMIENQYRTLGNNPLAASSLSPVGMRTINTDLGWGQDAPPPQPGGGAPDMASLMALIGGPGGGPGGPGGPEMGGGGWQPPVDPASVVGTGNKFGDQASVEGFHKGTDLQAYKGTPVTAPVTGTVVETPSDPQGLGQQVKVRDDATGEVHTMAHLDQALVQPGDHVEAGQPVGLVGSTGNSTGPHLDYRIQDQTGNYENPEQLTGALSQMPDASGQSPQQPTVGGPPQLGGGQGWPEADQSDYGDYSDTGQWDNPDYMGAQPFTDRWSGVLQNQIDTSRLASNNALNLMYGGGTTSTGGETGGGPGPSVANVGGTTTTPGLGPRDQTPPATGLSAAEAERNKTSLANARAAAEASKYGADKAYQASMANAKNDAERLAAEIQWRRERNAIEIQMKEIDAREEALNRQLSIAQSALKNPWLENLTGMAPAWGQPGAPDSIGQLMIRNTSGLNVPTGQQPAVGGGADDRPEATDAGQVLRGEGRLRTPTMWQGETYQPWLEDRGAVLADRGSGDLAQKIYEAVGALALAGEMAKDRVGGGQGWPAVGVGAEGPPSGLGRSGSGMNLNMVNNPAPQQDWQTLVGGYPYGNPNSPPPYPPGMGSSWTWDPGRGDWVTYNWDRRSNDDNAINEWIPQTGKEAWGAKLTGTYSGGTWQNPYAALQANAAAGGAIGQAMGGTATGGYQGGAPGSMAEVNEPLMGWDEFRAMDPFSRAAMRTRLELTGPGNWEKYVNNLRQGWGTSGGPTAAPTTSTLSATNMNPRQMLGANQIADVFGQTPDEYWKNQQRAWAPAQASQVSMVA